MRGGSGEMPIIETRRLESRPPIAWRQGLGEQTPEQRLAWARLNSAWLSASGRKRRVHDKEDQVEAQRFRKVVGVREALWNLMLCFRKRKPVRGKIGVELLAATGAISCKWWTATGYEAS